MGQEKERLLYHLSYEKNVYKYIDNFFQTLPINRKKMYIRASLSKIYPSPSDGILYVYSGNGFGTGFKYTYTRLPVPWCGWV